MRDVSVVVVNYRCEDATLECLKHLDRSLSSPPAAIVVIDNSPTDRLHSALARRPDLRYLPSPTNSGFAAAANRGIATTDTPRVVLLNPDARPGNQCLEVLGDRLRSEPDVAAAGPVLVSPDGRAPHPPSATSRDPSMLTALVEYTAAHRIIGRDWLHRTYFLSAKATPDHPVVDCAMVQGACLALDRRAFDSVGGFDSDRFFLYWEETDLELRLRRAGWRVLYCRDVTCEHLGGSWSGRDGDLRERHFWRGFYAYHRKHGGMAREIALRSAMIAGLAGELAILRGARLVRRRLDRTLHRDVALVRRRLRHQVERRPRADAP